MAAFLMVTATVFAYRKFTSTHKLSPVKNSTEPRAHRDGAPAVQFVDAVPILFHVEKFLEIPLPEGDASDPRVSPDATRIVFVRTHNSKGSLALAELPSGTLKNLKIPLDDIIHPSWSGDGKKLVFSGLKAGAWEIYLYEPDSGKLTAVTNDPSRKKSWPRLSPHRFDDHYRIAYASEENGRSDIWWVRESGHHDLPITVSPKRMETFRKSAYWKDFDGMTTPAPLRNSGNFPEWSPSGDMLLYRSDKGNACLRYRFDEWWKPAETRAPHGAAKMQWSPNQTSFLEYSAESGAAGIIRQDNSSPTPILASRKLTSVPAFFPDGQGFAFTYQKNGRSVLAVEPHNDPLGDISNLWMYQYNKGDREKLVKNQMLLKKGDSDQIYSLYESERYGDRQMVPYLVTSDAVLETFYAAFAALYAAMERQQLATALEEFSRHGVAAAARLKPGSDTEVMFQTGLILMKPESGTTMRPEARTEAKKVIAAAQGKQETLFGQKLDYSDFFIRGKYERDKDLQGYFRAIKWYQAFTFNIASPSERPHVSDILEVVSDGKASKALELLYSIYREMVGESRYLNPTNLKRLPQPGENTAFNSTLPWVKGTGSFRLLPSVYTLDAHIFDELVTHLSIPDSVGTFESPRTLPMGLDIMAAFGSGEARNILLNELKQGDYERYALRLDSLAGKINGFQRSAWESSLYQQWLDALSSLVQEPPAKAPAFAKTQAWKRKQLNTALGSWVNLRYETIAVVEQVTAEAGEGGYERLNTGKPRGYVEPDPEFFRRLDLAFARLGVMLERTAGSPELKKGIASKISVYRKHLNLLQTIAHKELEGVELTSDEYAEILNIGATIEHFIVLMGSLNGSDTNDQPLKTPEPVRKVVDVQSFQGTRLYEALGHVNELNLAVPYFGRRQLVMGPVYSYHEFTSAELIDSEKWRNSGKKQPPSWIRAYFAEEKSKRSPHTLPEQGKSAR